MGPSGKTTNFTEPPWYHSPHAGGRSTWPRCAAYILPSILIPNGHNAIILCAMAAEVNSRRKWFFMAGIIILALLYWLRPTPAPRHVRLPPTRQEQARNPVEHKEVSPLKPSPARAADLTPSRPATLPIHPPAGGEMSPTPPTQWESTYRPPVLIKIRVEDDSGHLVERATVQSRDCGFMRIAVSGITEISLDPAFERCTVRAGRRDGMLFSWSQVEEVELTGDTELVLQVDSEPVGGMGMQVAEHERGVLVQGLVPGAPASRAGIQAGEVVVEVDGVDSADLSIDDFILVATGPVGTRVGLVIAHPDENGNWTEREVTLTRELLKSE